MNINGNDYKLCLVDTNIVSDVLKLKQTQPIQKKFFNLIDEKVAYCFSMITLCELYPAKEELLYQFIETFVKTIPCLIFPTNSIRQNEVEAFPNFISQDQLKANKDFYVINPLFEKEISQAWEKFFKSEHFRTGSYGLKEDQKTKVKELEIQIEYLKNKVNSKNLPIKFNEFVKNRLKQLSMTDDILTDDICSYNNKYLSMEKLRILLILYKHIIRNQEITLSDVTDVLICSLSPWMDIIITDNSNAESLREIKNKTGLLDNLKIMTMRDLRENPFTEEEAGG